MVTLTSKSDLNANANSFPAKAGPETGSSQHGKREFKSPCRIYAWLESTAGWHLGYPCCETHLPLHHQCGNVPANGAFNLAWGPCTSSGPIRRTVVPLLLNLCAAALNQNYQHDDKENACSNPDNRRCIHHYSPSFKNKVSCASEPI